jgi:hypothetical protein
MAQTCRSGRSFAHPSTAAVTHRYRVGDLVALTRRAGHFMKSESVFTVIAQLPLLGRDFQYRIKCIAEPYERVASEDQLGPMALPCDATSDGLFKQPDKQTI